MIKKLFYLFAAKVYRAGKHIEEKEIIDSINHSGHYYIRNPQYIKKPENIYLENNVFVNTGVTIQAYASVSIGEGTTIGPNVTITTANHDTRKLGVDLWNDVISDPVVIGKNCWIGAGAIILPGVTIGEQSVIGAGSIVTKSIPDNTIAAGVPCRVIKSRVTDDEV